MQLRLGFQEPPLLRVEVPEQIVASREPNHFLLAGSGVLFHRLNEQALCFFVRRWRHRLPKSKCESLQVACATQVGDGRSFLA